MKTSDQDHEGLRGCFRCSAGSLKGFNIRIIGRGMKSRRPEMTIFQYVFMTDL